MLQLAEYMHRNDQTNKNWKEGYFSEYMTSNMILHLLADKKNIYIHGPNHLIRRKIHISDNYMYVGKNKLLKI